MSEIGGVNRSGGDQLNPCSLSLANYEVLEGAGHDFSILFEASVIVELYSRENEQEGQRIRRFCSRVVNLDKKLLERVDSLHKE
jgi:hypothetical protein